MTFRTDLADRYECLWFMEEEGPVEIADHLLENFTPNWLQHLKEEATAKADAEVLDLVEGVKKRYLEVFEISFSYPETKNNSAKAVRFRISGVDYYHIDFKLNGIPEGNQRKLYRLPTGGWRSDHGSFNTLIAERIARPLNKHTRRIISREKRQSKLSKCLRGSA